MARTIKVVDAKTRKPIEIGGDKTKAGLSRSPSFPDALLRRIQAIHAGIKYLYSMSLEQFEISLMRAADPESEIVVWEQIVTAFERAKAAMPHVEERMILWTLQVYFILALKPEEQADPIVMRIIEIAEAN